MRSLADDRFLHRKGNDLEFSMQMLGCFSCLRVAVVEAVVVIVVLAVHDGLLSLLCFSKK